MKVALLLCSIACACVVAGRETSFAAKPLATAAQSLAKETKNGTIVTGEWREGRESFSAAGKAGPKSVPAEKIVFEIGSISKVFTGLLLAQSALEKKVRFDNTLRELLGKTQNYADVRVGQITLLQLVTHTSGLPRLADNHAAFADPADPYAKYDRAALSQYLENAKLEGEGPYLESYSNLGMGLLGDVLARVHGRTWEELVRERITVPLGMSDTTVTLGAEQAGRFIQPYAGGEKKQPWTFTAMAGAGALRSTARDMLIFGRALLHPQKTPFAQAIELLTSPQVPDGGSGLAIRLGKLDGQRVWEHDGGTGGFRSSLQVFPDADVVRVVLVNDAKLSSGKVLAAARLPTSGKITKKSGPELPAAALAEYTGVYDLDKQARFTCLIRDGRLAIRLTGQTFLDALPSTVADRFFLKAVDAEFQFEREGGRVTSLALYQNGRELTARKNATPAPALIFRSQKELSTFAGTYTMVLGSADFTVEVRNRTLFVKLTGQEFLPVFETKKDWFASDIVDAAFDFPRNGKGAITALRLHQNGIVQVAMRKP